MKKTAFVLVMVMLLSSCLSVFASALDAQTAGTAAFTLDPYTVADGENIAYDGASTNDRFCVAVNLATQNEAFGAYQYEISFDATKIELKNNRGGAQGPNSKYPYTPAYALPYSVMNPDKKAEGIYIQNYGAAENVAYEDEDTFEMVDVYAGTVSYLIFEPITDEACDVTINFTSTLVKNVTQYKPGFFQEIPSTGTSLTLKLNGGAPAAAAAVVSLGAQVNTAKHGIRFGATYNKIAENGEVTALGMLLLPAAKLGEDTLDLDYVAGGANGALVANVLARSIDVVTPGYKFEDYTTFNFTCAVIGIPEAQFASDIVAVPYITYDGVAGAIYAEAMIRNYNAVLAAQS